jgi:myo-inositol 2-dehydrogenase / D-chiro-inositol 1-dehydrogenase
MPSIALLGAGMISRAHAAAAQILGVPVVAVTSRTPESAGAFAERVGARAVRYDELTDGADVIVVATPPALHASQTLEMLERGAAVVLEKPLCTTLADADVLVEAAGDRVLYAENLAYAPVVHAMIPRVRELGALNSLEVRSLQGRPTWGNFLSEEWGGGALFDLGVHPVAVALLLAAPAVPVGVHAVLEGADDHPTDEFADVTITFDTGLQGHVVSSWRDGPTPVWDAQVSSATGVVRAELLPEPELEVNGEPVALPPVTAPVPQLEQYGYIGQLQAFLDDLEHGRRPLMDVNWGRMVLDVVCAAYASAASGEPEPTPFRGPRNRTPLQLWRG